VAERFVGTPYLWAQEQSWDRLFSLVQVLLNAAGIAARKRGRGGSASAAH
jgi:hypothetical protein